VYKRQLSAVSEDRLAEIGRELGVEFIDDVGQLAATIVSETIGFEIWDTLLFIVLWLLAGECLVTKWIRSRRSVTPIAESESNDPFPVAPFSTAMGNSDRWENVAVDDSIRASDSAFVGAP